MTKNLALWYNGVRRLIAWHACTPACSVVYDTLSVVAPQPGRTRIPSGCGMAGTRHGNPCLLSVVDICLDASRISCASYASSYLISLYITNAAQNEGPWLGRHFITRYGGYRHV